MATSQNGWSASPSLKLRKLVVNGVSFAPGIRDDADVAYVLGYFAEQYAARVEPLRSPGCWGFSYRADRNQASDLSNHASGTAIDLNAPQHPNDVPTSRTFTAKQIAEVHQILTECHGALRWGGDYTHTVDAMHVEVNVSAARLREVVKQMKRDASARPAKVQKSIDKLKKAKKQAKGKPTQKKRIKKALGWLRKIGGKK
jgi:hypothetical protein